MNKTPALGLGTFCLKGQVVIDSVHNGLELSYRVIDTTQICGNEAEVGETIAGSGVRREDLFLMTKIRVDDYARDKFVASLEDDLAKLRTGYVGLTLIYRPVSDSNVSIEEFMTALTEAKARGLTREIGISNFNIALTQQTVVITGKDAIATNQIELSPYLQSHKLVEFLQCKGIHVASYVTLVYGKALGDPVIGAIAQRHEAMPARAVLAWAMQPGYSVIPSPTEREHFASNLRMQTPYLTDEDMARIVALERNGREVSPDGLAPQWD